jgi:hypothetical protein
MFDIPFIADWRKIGDDRQRQTDLNKRIVYDHKVGDKILVQNKRYSPQSRVQMA